MMLVCSTLIAHCKQSLYNILFEHSWKAFKQQLNQVYSLVYPLTRRGLPEGYQVRGFHDDMFDRFILTHQSVSIYKDSHFKPAIEYQRGLCKKSTWKLYTIQIDKYQNRMIQYLSTYMVYKGSTKGWMYVFFISFPGSPNH